MTRELRLRDTVSLGCGRGAGHGPRKEAELDQETSGSADRNTVPDLYRLLFAPDMQINGPIDESTLAYVLDRLSFIHAGNQDLVLELNTIGGDADVARRIALELRLFAAHSGRSAFCVGKTYVYSAGVTILAAFRREYRFLTEDAVLLIHERHMEQDLALVGPVEANLQIIREKMSLLESARRLENEGFADLVEGSRLTVEQLLQCIRANCYMTAKAALDHGLVEKILR